MRKINKNNIVKTLNFWSEKKMISDSINKNFCENPLKNKRL